MRKKAGMLLILGMLAGALDGQTPIPSALASESTSLADSAETLTLFEPTELYDDRYQQVGMIAPQQVHVLQTSSIRRGHGEGYRVPRYLISTWMGNAWIVPDNALRGKEEPMDAYIELSDEETLYNDPGLLSPKGKIDKQTVKAIANWDKRYKVATPEGEGWIAPNWAAVGVKLVQTDVQLTAPTRLFRFPYQDAGASVNPQLMQVTAVWRDWYRADSWLGPVWFRLHELDATDADHRMEAGLRYYYFDGNQTRFRASVQLGPKWRETGETIPVGFTVLLYNEKGERIGASSGAAVRLKGGEATPVELTVDQNIQTFAYATVQVGMFNDQIVSAIQPDDPMAIADDAANHDLRLGSIQVRRDGVFSIVTGQYASKLAGEHHMKAELSFLNANGTALAKAPLEFALDASYPGNGLLQPFEAVVPEDVSTYASVKLKVLEVR
ncbi:hypothetical protein [Paenibacillus oleatilyticus]|uniref:hypothetical protein n=1 Tax=Paenibacillus oleatilyticus TaxID=2594886 RepID=UPI001C1FDB37|nr:hypothetical protein [Paenibacillus oleatilyticus]MBU7317235.1 hypothetical protein [Paenibacillus oleatilyticus]